MWKIRVLIKVFVDLRLIRAKESFHDKRMKNAS